LLICFDKRDKNVFGGQRFLGTVSVSLFVGPAEGKKRKKEMLKFCSINRTWK